MLGEQEPLGPLSSWLPNIMVATLDICCAGQEWSGSPWCCRGTGKSNHLPPEPQSSQTPSPSSWACVLPSVSLAMLPCPQATQTVPVFIPVHLAPSVALPPSSPPPAPREGETPGCFVTHTCLEHLVLAPCGHGQTTLLGLSFKFPPRQNQAFAGMKSDQVCDDDANNNCYLSGTCQV